MGWLKKIFKGSSHKSSEGQYRGEPTDEIVEHRSSNSSDSTPDSNEDIDRASDLSLSEQEEEESLTSENAARLEEDEQLARALQESLDVESSSEENLDVESSSEENDHAYQPIPFVSSSGFRTCAGCNNEIGHERFLSCMGAVWHPECLKCHACNQPISDYEFTMAGNQPYHKFCYRELSPPICDVCKQYIPTSMNGLVEYRFHPFWRHKYCPSHDIDGTPRCGACGRMEPRDADYVALGDGRNLCLECLESAIMDTSECQPLYLEIQEFFEGLNMKVEQEIPLLLVERQALNEAMEGEKDGNYHLPETRGLCLSEEQTVRTILSRPTIEDNQITDMITEPYTLIRECEVTAILVLYGLPRLLTGSILAHEMMHAWLRLNGYGTLTQEVEEGICQVLAHMWVDSELMAGCGSDVASTSSSSSSSSTIKGPRSEFERKFGEFVKHKIQTDPTAVYGDGFRAGNQAVKQYGLRGTLEHIESTGSFPG